MKSIVLPTVTALMLAASATVASSEGISSGSSRDDVGNCFLMRRSPILDLPSLEAMETAVEKRYEHSVGISQSESAISSRRPVFAWASEAKVACGKAIGYFKGREINDEMISKCDCFHGRMLAHMR